MESADVESADEERTSNNLLTKPRRRAGALLTQPTPEQDDVAPPSRRDVVAPPRSSLLQRNNKQAMEEDPVPMIPKKSSERALLGVLKQRQHSADAVNEREPHPVREDRSRHEGVVSFLQRAAAGRHRQSESSGQHQLTDAVLGGQRKSGLGESEEPSDNTGGDDTGTVDEESSRGGAEKKMMPLLHRKSFSKEV